MLINHKVALQRWNGHLPVDSFSISKGLGITLIPDTSLDLKNLSLIVTKKNNSIMFNSLESSQRQRFLIAYALGFLLNYNDKLRVHKENIMIYKNPKKPEEIMTNELIDFSLNFLVPDEKLVTLLNSDQHLSVEDLAKLFDVSRKVMEFRIKKIMS